MSLIPLCDCVAALAPEEVDQLEPRDDESLGSALARKRRIEAAVFAFVVTPIALLAVYLLRNNPHMSGLFWFCALAGSLFFGGYSLHRLFSTSPTDATDPSTVTGWLTEHSFLLRSRSDKTIQSLFQYVLPSHRARYDDCQAVLQSFRKDKGGQHDSDLSYGDPSTVVYPDIRTGQRHSVASFEVPLLVFTGQSAKTVGALRLWLVESPHRNWWLTIHSEECVKRALKRNA